MPISTIGSNSLNQTSDLTINGVTVGKGGGAVSTNTAVGTSALAANTTGLGNTSVGYQALDVSTSSDYHTAVGWNALGANTTGARNTAFGAASLATNSTGGYNVAMGVNAGYAVTTGSNNVAIGYDSLSSNTTASNNTAVGYQAGYSQTTSPDNVFMGNKAGYSTSTGNGSNTFIGQQAGYSHTTGRNNQFFGGGSGYYITTGSKNTILGAYTGNQGGLDIRTGSNYIVLSDGDGNPRLIGDNNGNWGIAKASNSSKLYIYVNTNVTSDAIVSQPATDSGVNAYVFKNNAGGNAGYIQYSSTTTSYVTSSDYRLKENITPMTGALAKVAQLKPVTYDWKSGGSSQGFIAHELAEVVPDCVKGEKDALDKDGNPDYQGIDTSFLVATLTSAIQELKAIVDAQAAEIAELKAKVA